MASFTDYLKLYKWNAIDTKQQTIDEMTNNALKLEKYFMRYQVDVEDFGGKPNDPSFDNTPPILLAIAYLQVLGGGTLRFGYGTYYFTQTINVPDIIKFIGISEDESITCLKYTGSGFALQTSSYHLRNAFKNFSLNLNYGASGIKIGQAQVDRDNGKIPRQISIENVRIGELATGFYGVRLENASHIYIKSSRLAYGSGGTGLSIWNDNCNAGVVSVIDSTIGRINEMDVGLEIDSTYQAGLDSYVFSGCYFGGKVPIKLGASVDVNSKVRNVTFNAIHIETTSPASGTANGVEIYKADALTFNGVTLAGFSNPNINGFCFKGESKSITIHGVDINEFQGIVFKNEAGNDLDNSLIQEASVSGANSTGYTMFSGNFEYVTKLTGKRLKHSQIQATSYFSDTGNKTEWGTQSPATDSTPKAWSRGDMRFMVNGAELGTAGSKYTLIGWKCIGSGTPGTWVEMRALTGN